MSAVVPVARCVPRLFSSRKGPGGSKVHCSRQDPRAARPKVRITPLLGSRGAPTCRWCSICHWGRVS